MSMHPVSSLGSPAHMQGMSHWNGCNLVVAQVCDLSRNATSRLCAMKRSDPDAEISRICCDSPDQQVLVWILNFQSLGRTRFFFTTIRDRELTQQDTDIQKFKYIYIYIHICVYIYIYIYMRCRVKSWSKIWGFLCKNWPKSSVKNWSKCFFSQFAPNFIVFWGHV